MAPELFSARSDPNAGTVSIAGGQKPPIHSVMVVRRLSRARFQTDTSRLGRDHSLDVPLLPPLIVQGTTAKPVILETIDAIARRLGRDVIFLDIRDRQDRPTRDRPEVAAATAWLDAEGIGWKFCFGFEPGWAILEGGPLAIYIDAPFEPGSALLARLEARFEAQDREHPHPDLILTLLRIAVAMVNADQDAPGFWDNF